MADTIGRANPFLYRGYCCDAETGLYSLNSRYYDPQTGRFLNADGQFNPETGLAGNNIFAYCNNDPTGLADNGGSRPMAMSENGIESIEDQIIAAKFNSEAHRKAALASSKSYLMAKKNLDLLQEKIKEKVVTRDNRQVLEREMLLIQMEKSIVG